MQMLRHLTVVVAACAASLAQAVSLRNRAQDALVAGLNERPVMKVVRLLQDMKTELEASLADDKAVHEKMTCWCKENDQEKSAAIETGEAKESELTNYLGENEGERASLKTKRDDTLEEVNNDVAAKEDASTLRMKENKEFHADEANLVEAIKACGQAITVLKEHNTNFAQVKSAADTLQKARVLELGLKAWGSSRAPQVAALKSFLREAQGSMSFLAIPGYQSYAPRSGQIFGVLEQMKEDFEKDLADAQAKEKKAAGEFSSLKAAKTEEITAGRTLQANLDGDIAELEEKHAEAFKELDGTKAQLDLDRTFLENLKKKCSESATEFDQRVKDRLEEIAAVEDTIGFLNNDESFANFTNTVNTAFFQVSSDDSSSGAQKELVSKAVARLQQAAKDTGAPELSLLAMKAQLDAFTKVKEEIDKMVTQLNKQQQDEIKHRDWCIDELNTNNRTTEEHYDKKASLQAKQADLEKTISYLEKEIKSTTASVAEMQKQMKRASENREAENADFQQTVSDHRMTQMILNKAHGRMKQVYAMLQEEPQVGAAHIATSGNHTDPGNGPARFTKYEKHSGGSKVLRMIEAVIKDSQKTENDAMASEQDSQTAYETMMKDSNAAITVYTKKIANMNGAKAKADEDHVATKNDVKATMSKLEDLHGELGSLKSSCDFIMDTFDARQAARTEEVEALKDAKAILSGMQ